jgi:hypothetical protein
MNELSFVFQMAFSETLYNDGQTSGDQEKKASNPRATRRHTSNPSVRTDEGAPRTFAQLDPHRGAVPRQDMGF